MAEELQNLLERIQKESVEKAEQQADELIAAAKKKAATIVEEAKAKAEQSLKQADVDAEAFTARSKKTLEQAARDLLITVGNGIESLFTKLVKDSVDAGLSSDVVADMLSKICDASSLKDGVDIALNEEDQKKVVAFFNAKFADAVKKGDVVIKTDNEIIKGFTVALKNEDVYTDFTGEAIAEALMKFLRPQLAEIVQEAAKQG